MVQPLDTLKETSSQTAGPYVHIGLTPNFAGISGIYDEDLGTRIIEDGVRGERITVAGKVIDGTGTPLKDAVIEIWQADADGLYNSPSETRGEADPKCRGWGRFPVDGADGSFSFETVKPGRVAHPSGRDQAPHLTFWIVARGINIGLQTRMYFADEEEANSEDPILTKIEHQSRVPTLIACKEADGYRFDIRIQGHNETIFFDI
ncbi:protocatechuate 3,4-dioxygenase subunit alpha [Notoacmeibacter sp. MSK16QG-6]|uniref:protocatechuate 3,4-dioxygenase subunit alpha n=1 Tax=Notoacmeibacter sp. MSK16QG-6 TaxID=2957982 RepID=UPI0020A163B7|nr:protocatechuate 3,4-dioxygenase subunit alpha [Notoacmeibacter sp. MSK16QG-6]MCP1199602.1 protocatechuate 3,4-dioxygenase subunit alpha [Notoacmeibacter sp. MSK16QG-6]